MLTSSVGAVNVRCSPSRSAAVTIRLGSMAGACASGGFAVRGPRDPPAPVTRPAWPKPPTSGVVSRGTVIDGCGHIGLSAFRLPSSPGALAAAPGPFGAGPVDSASPIAGPRTLPPFSPENAFPGAGSSTPHGAAQPPTGARALDASTPVGPAAPRGREVLGDPARAPAGRAEPIRSPGPSTPSVSRETRFHTFVHPAPPTRLREPPPGHPSVGTLISWSHEDPHHVPTSTIAYHPLLSVATRPRGVLRITRPSQPSRARLPHHSPPFLRNVTTPLGGRTPVRPTVLPPEQQDARSLTRALTADLIRVSGRERVSAHRRDGPAPGDRPLS